MGERGSPKSPFFCLFVVCLLFLYFLHNFGTFEPGKLRPKLCKNLITHICRVRQLLFKSMDEKIEKQKFPEGEP